MAFWLTLLRLLRQRGVALRALGVALGLMTVALVTLPTTYVSTSTVVLTSSPVNQAAIAGEQGVPSAINPLLNFSEGLNTALAILIQVMNTPEVVAELTGDDATATTVITNVGPTGAVSNSGPFLYFTGSSTRSAQTARDLVVRAQQRTSKELQDRQQALGAPVNQFISMIVVIQPTTPVALRSTKLDGALLGFILGFSSVLGISYLREAGRLSRPTGKVAGRVAPPPTAPPPQAPSPMSRPVVAKRGRPLPVNGFEHNGQVEAAAVASAGVSTASGELLLLDPEEDPRAGNSPGDASPGDTPEPEALDHDAETIVITETDRIAEEDQTVMAADGPTPAPDASHVSGPSTGQEPDHDSAEATSGDAAATPDQSTLRVEAESTLPVETGSGHTPESVDEPGSTTAAD
jgi:hypothetical protein